MRTSVKITLLCCFFATITSVNAQYYYPYSDRDHKGVIVGVRGGLVVSGKHGGNSSTTKTGFDIGLTLDFRLADKLYLLTGLDYTVKGGKTKDGNEWEMSDENGKYRGSMNENPAYLQLPFRLGYKFPIVEDFYIMPYAGPYIAYGLGGKTKYTYRYIDTDKVAYDKRPTFDGNVNRFDYGVGFGVSTEYKQFVLGFEYDLGLQRFAKKEAGYSDDKNKNFAVTLGYKF